MATPPEMNDFSKLVGLSLNLDAFVNPQGKAEDDQGKIQGVFIRSLASPTEQYTLKKQTSLFRRFVARLQSFLKKNTYG